MYQINTPNNLPEDILDNQKFIEYLNYLKTLKAQLKTLDQNLSNEELFILLIKNAVLTDKYNEGSILLTRWTGKFTVSNIQKYNYGWLLEGKIIDMEKILATCEELGINYDLHYAPVGNNINDWEFKFNVNLEKEKTRIK